MKLYLYWKVAHPCYVITDENVADIQATFTIGMFGNTYQEPMYQLLETGTEKQLIGRLSDDLNCTVRRGHNGPVIYSRKGSVIFREGDEPEVVNEKTYTARPGANDDLCPPGSKWGDVILRRSFSDGSKTMEVL